MIHQCLGVNAVKANDFLTQPKFFLDDAGKLFKCDSLHFFLLAIIAFNLSSYY